MRSHILIWLLVGVNVTLLQSQHFEEIPGEDKSELKTIPIEGYYPTPEIYPQFIGGETALDAFRKTNLNLACMDSCGEGRSWIGFTIDTIGRLTNVELLRGFCKKCDDEALRVVSMMPDWEPGYIYGKKNSCKFRFPIIFKKE
jgi:protein TonB